MLIIESPIRHNHGEMEKIKAFLGKVCKKISDINEKNEEMISVSGKRQSKTQNRKQNAGGGRIRKAKRRKQQYSRCKKKSKRILYFGGTTPSNLRGTSDPTTVTNPTTYRLPININHDYHGLSFFIEAMFQEDNYNSFFFILIIFLTSIIIEITYSRYHRAVDLAEHIARANFQHAQGNPNRHLERAIERYILLHPEVFNDFNLLIVREDNDANNPPPPPANNGLEVVVRLIFFGDRENVHVDFELENLIHEE